MSTAVIGAPEFRARSGRTVRSKADGSVVFDHVNGYLGPEQVFDAEEFFQARRDAELGRWRCLTDPDWVAAEGVRTVDGRTVVVVNERTLDRFWFNERVRDTATKADVAHRVGRAYFEAHPERKPWEEAERGEAWKLREADAYPGIAVLTEEMGWLWATGRAVDLTRIVDGECIWPEDAS